MHFGCTEEWWWRSAQEPRNPNILKFEILNPKTTNQKQFSARVPKITIEILQKLRIAPLNAE